MARVHRDQRAHRLWLLRAGLTLCLAASLGIVPFGRLWATAAQQVAFDTPAAQHAPGGEERALGAPDQRPGEGILPRVPSTEEALVSTAAKALPPRPQASIEPAPSQSSPDNPAGTDPKRSSVGTSRHPTGPPA